MNHWEIMDTATMVEARECYDYVLNKYNDDMGRFGFAGDNSSKAERETTGENFRAMQPNSVYQKTILQKLKVVTKNIQEMLQQQVNFGIGIQANEQGLPEFEDGINEDEGKNEMNKDNE